MILDLAVFLKLSWTRQILDSPSALEYSRNPSILFMISLRIDQRFSIGFRSGELAGHNPLPQEVMSWVYNHSVVVLAE